MNYLTQQKDIRKLRTAWLETGNKEGAIALFLHGYPDDASIWEFQVKALEAKYHIVCPYTRGTGHSTPSHEIARYSSDALSLDVMQILAEVDPTKEKPVILIGHDLGGALAWNLTALLGAQLKGLIIINSLSAGQMLKRFKNPHQLVKSWYMLFMQLPLVPEAVFKSFPRTFSALAYQTGGLSVDKRPEIGDPRKVLVAPLNQYRALAREIPMQLRKRPRKIQCPLLVLWGSEDPFLVEPNEDEFKPYSADTTIRILKGGHWIFREKPEEVNTHLRDFMERLDLNRG